MFTQHSLSEGKKSVKRKVDTAFEMTEQVRFYNTVVKEIICRDKSP